MDKTVNGDDALAPVTPSEPVKQRLAKAMQAFAQTVAASQADARGVFHYSPVDEVIQRKVLHIQLQLLTDIVVGQNGPAFLAKLAERLEAETVVLRKPRIALAVKGALQ